MAYFERSVEIRLILTIFIIWSVKLSILSSQISKRFIVNWLYSFNDKTYLEHVTVLELFSFISNSEELDFVLTVYFISWTWNL
jgi:hypothetical protein